MQVTAAEYDGKVPPSSAMDFDRRSDGLYDMNGNRVIEFKAEPVAWTTDGSSFAATFISSCEGHYDLLSGLVVPGKVLDYAVRIWDLEGFKQQSVVISTDSLEGVEAMGFVEGRLLVCGTKSVWVTPKKS